MNKDKLFFRIILYFGIMVILGFVVGGIGKVLVFFNSGGNKADMLKTAEYLPDGLSPKINWLPDVNSKGRIMEDFNRSLITAEYIRALNQRNRSLLTYSTEGLKEYFTLNSRPNVFSQINNVENRSIDLEKVELNHNLKLHFYSADGQLVSFTDFDVKSKMKIEYPDSDQVYFVNDTSAYLVLMQLDDGYWRIKNRQNISSDFLDELITENVDSLEIIKIKNSFLKEVKASKGINYYPQDYPFKDFWIKYDSIIIERDMALIKSLDFNTVRVFVNFEQFGKGDVVPEMLERLNHFLNSANQNGLKVLVTLFDFNGNYHLFNYQNTERQMEVIMTRFKFHPGLLAYDLKNEPDLDFIYQDREDVQEWLEHMLEKAHEYDPFHPITLGWSSIDKAHLYADKVDFVSFHYYRTPGDLKKAILSLKNIIGDKPLVLGEFGLSSYQSRLFPINVNQGDQAVYYKDVLQVLKEYGMPHYVWTLYDFTEVSGDVAGNRPWQKEAQKHFGIFDKDGDPKELHKAITNENYVYQASILSKIPHYLKTYSILFVLLIGGVLIKAKFF
ncbi:MAG: hypothetical protein ACI9IP_002816 [Arcticibacterium sp.]|jgi:hypothetical protein